MKIIFTGLIFSTVMMFISLGTMWGYYSDSTFLQILAVVTNLPNFIANEVFQALGIVVSADFDIAVFGTIHYILWAFFGGLSFCYTEPSNRLLTKRCLRTKILA